MIITKQLIHELSTDSRRYSMLVTAITKSADEVISEEVVCFVVSDEDWLTSGSRPERRNSRRSTSTMLS